MHCVVNRVPAADDIVFALNQQWIEVNVNSANSIMSTVCVMVQNPVIRQHYSTETVFN